MNRNVTFKTLWLVSETEQKARKQTFPTQRTILFGTNGTGKSRITKNLFWTLGCTPEKQLSAGWDPDFIGVLEFEYESKTYTVVRQRKNLGLFAENGALIACANNMGTWNRIMADKFGYKLMLQRPQSTTASRLGVEYLTLPTYIDQDGGWGATWSSFKNLSQFKAWKKPVFEAYIGLRPNAYFAAKQLWQEASDVLKGMQEKFDTQKSAFKRVREILPKNVPVLSDAQFENELVDLGEKARDLQQRQNELRAKLVSAVNRKEQISSSLRLAVENHRNLTDDLGFISERNEENIECPTCGTLHENSFHARLQLTQDAHAFALLVAELRAEKAQAVARHEQLLAELADIGKQSREITSTIREEQAGLQAKELLLAAHSAQTLDNAFEAVTSELSEEISAYAAKVETLKGGYKIFEDRARTTEVGDYFSTSVTWFSNKLNVPAEEQIKKTKPGDRGNSGGSSGPRSLLAVHLAMVKSNAAYGDTPLFPLVIDTLQQSGQDLKNLSSMVEILNGNVGINQQIILAVEMLPPTVDISNFNVVNLTEDRALLNPDDFKNVGFLAEMMGTLKKAINQDDEADELTED
ncbi:hypothetical protein [Herbaspirillum sp. C7C8]|uniref:hypothetical protein n=1 Tax=Herbaspirillum sp. C7C8 TaxID=2736665 RepID=UPI001F524296|nr:hypothetical protein [Herbaspirillum sp. C7C8]MCI1004284.1 hypothetical protein [Herbaspirillum sp. C7C8]